MKIKKKKRNFVTYWRDNMLTVSTTRQVSVAIVWKWKDEDQSKWCLSVYKDLKSFESSFSFRKDWRTAIEWNEVQLCESKKIGEFIL